MSLSAALVASRKAVPTNVKDQPPRPFTDKTKPLYRTTAGDAMGKWGIAKIPNYAELCSQIGVGDVLFFNQKPVKIFGSF